MSARDAILKYSGKQLPSKRKRQTRNKKPEKLVESNVLQWSKNNGMFLHVIESSSYDPRLGTIGTQKAESGFSDLVGNTDGGFAIYIELKAKDRRSTLRLDQRIFLENKIDQGCFAVVTDSVEHLAHTWTEYKSLDRGERKHYLLGCLPRQISKKDAVNPEFGF